MLKRLCVVLIISTVISAEDGDKEAESPESSRELRVFQPEVWRVLEHEQPDMTGWVPHQNQEELPVRRRRIRKRKRRPPVMSLTESEDDPNYSERFYQPRRRIRPQRLDQNRGPWEEMEQESMRKPAIRRKIIPSYQSKEISSEEQQTDNPVSEKLVISPLQATLKFEDPEYTKSKVQEKIRDPFTALQEAEEKQKSSPEEITQKSTTSSDLKTLLKQSDGLSLSEILQQKNLSLSELLTGDRKAISALTEKSAVTESALHITEVNPSDSTKYQRLPPSVALKKSVNRNYEQFGESAETLTSKETLDAQRKRLALLHGHRETKLYPDVTKYDVVTEPVTERRIFIPSNSKHNSSVNYKSNFFPEEEKLIETTPKLAIELSTMAPVSTTTEQKVTENSNTVIPPKPITRKLPVTSAKMLRTTAHTYSVDRNIPVVVNTSPPTEFKIDLETVFSSAFKKIQQQTTDNHVDEPLKITIDINKYTPAKPFTQKTSSVPSYSKFEENLNSSKETAIVATTTNIPPNDKLKIVTAKEEIMEILRDPESRNRLSKILETRNMTIQELVDQRERGSSQLHLADIFHNKTLEPEPKDEPFVGQVSSGRFTNLSRKQKSRTFPKLIVKNTNYEPTVARIKPLELSSSDEIGHTLKPIVVTLTNFPSYKMELNDTPNSKAPPFKPFWKDYYPDFLPAVYDNNNQQSNLESDKLQRLEQLENKLSEVVNERLNIDLKQNSYKIENESFLNLPSGVKSAIIASFAIIALSLFIFLTILVIFKWSQKKKTRLNYCSSFSGSKIKSPILDGPTRSFKTFVSETLGRRKNNYYKSNLQSMTDNIWEEKKPF